MLMTDDVAVVRLGDAPLRVPTGNPADYPCQMAGPAAPVSTGDFGRILQALSAAGLVNQPSAEPQEQEPGEQADD
jgi:hypothetical protein